MTRQVRSDGFLTINFIFLRKLQPHKQQLVMMENNWNLVDDFDFYVHVENLPFIVKECKLAPEACMAICKINQVDECLDEETMSDIIWESHPRNIFKTPEPQTEPQPQEEPEEDLPELLVDRKRARFIKSKHAVDCKRKIEPLTMALRPTRNGGLKPGTKSGVHAYFKRYDRKIARYSAKEEIRNADLDVNLYTPSFWDDDEDWHLREEMAEFSSETSDGRIWHDADQIPEMIQNEVDDLEYDYEEEIIARAFTERDLYEEFVNNFNLRTLFNKWLEEKKEGAK